MNGMGTLSFLQKANTTRITVIAKAVPTMAPNGASALL
jgi:hypothetical protein